MKTFFFFRFTKINQWRKNNLHQNENATICNTQTTIFMKYPDACSFMKVFKKKGVMRLVATKASIIVTCREAIKIFIFIYIHGSISEWCKGNWQQYKKGTKHKLLVDRIVAQDGNVTHKPAYVSGLTTAKPLTGYDTHGCRSAWNCTASTGHQKSSSETL